MHLVVNIVAGCIFEDSPENKVINQLKKNFQVLLHKQQKKKKLNESLQHQTSVYIYSFQCNRE